MKIQKNSQGSRGSNPRHLHTMPPRTLFSIFSRIFRWFFSIFQQNNIIARKPIHTRKIQIIEGTSYFVWITEHFKLLDFELVRLDCTFLTISWKYIIGSGRAGTTGCMYHGKLGSTKGNWETEPIKLKFHYLVTLYSKLEWIGQIKNFLSQVKIKKTKLPF